MFGLDMLNVLIGLVTVYLAFGVACTAIVEAAVAFLGVRSSNLEAALNEFLAGNLTSTQKFVQAFYDHPLVQALSKGKDGRPSYLPPEIVGQVVQALVTGAGSGTSLAQGVNLLPDEPAANRVKGLLGALLKQSGDDPAAFRKAVETQFNAVMDRTSGWFKRYTQYLALGASAVLVIGANVDTVSLVTSLASSPEARTKIVAIAEQQVAAATVTEKSAEDQVKAGKSEAANALKDANEKAKAARATLDRATSNLESAGLPFGWKEYPSTPEGISAKVAGLLVSIFAVSLGAPFWFSVLQRFMQVRSAGVLPDDSKAQKK
jgi:hypothetical protein